MYPTPSESNSRFSLSSRTVSGKEDGLAKQILQLLQEEFMIRFPAFPEIFGQLTPVPDAQTELYNCQNIHAEKKHGSAAALGTDGSHLYYNPALLCAEFLRSPKRLKHTYLHVHMHCLCLHMFQIPKFSKRQDRQNRESRGASFPEHSGPQNETAKEENRKNLWDQACDLSAEFMTGLLLGEEQNRLTGQLREAVSEISSLSSFSAENDPQKADGFSGFPFWDASSLLPLLQISPALRELALECSCDTHRFWYVDAPEGSKTSSEQARASGGEDSARKHSGSGRQTSFLRAREALEERWVKQRRRLNAFLTDGSGQKSGQTGQNAEDAALQKPDEMDYRKFLHQFAVPREEPVLDMDSFDYIPYYYGLTRYENMLFLEPLEYSEVNRLDEFAIAIDTSGSCSGRIVRRFLEETWNILRQKENFFARMRLHLIQCDSMIQEHRIITSVEQWEETLPDLKILGLGNTDFRPVFDYLNTLIEKKEIRRLRGLLYFTDGDGIYPKTRPPFDTAFVFLNRRLEKQKIPDWGIRLNLDLPETFDA